MSTRIDRLSERFFTRREEVLPPADEFLTEDERRCYRRVAAPIMARPSRFLRIVPTEVLDASLGGVRIYSDELFKRGERMDLDLFLPNGTSLKCHAVVAWIRALSPGSAAHYDVGLCIDDIADADAARLGEVLVDVIDNEPDPRNAA